MPRVLVVDDEEGLCLVLKDTLELEGYEVETCRDAASARKKLAQSRFDAALVDVFLSDQPAGIELGKEILSKLPRTSLVFMTGYAEEADIRQGFEAGAYGCIRKPFTLDGVIRVVGMALGEESGAKGQSVSPTPES